MKQKKGTADQQTDPDLQVSPAAVENEAEGSKSTPIQERTVVTSPPGESFNEPLTQPEREDQWVGKTLFGKYEIVELLGEGGMSRVYKARQILTKKFVALKMLHKHLSSNWQMIRRFQAEAQSSSHLTHPHIITVYDFGITENSQPYMVMEYLEGRPLSEIIRTWGQLDVERCMKIFDQACQALECAHENGVLHRDLKPSNIVLVPISDDPDFVKLVDFGIAKILPKAGIDSLELTQSGDVFGSPLYMSPEQCLGRMTDARSDIYSMGCLMYEALAGHPPLIGNNMLETMHKQISEMPSSLGDVKADVRLVKQLEEIIFKAMAKDPENRFQSVRELRAAIEETRNQWKECSTLAATLKRASSKWARIFQNRLGKQWKLKLACAAVFCFAMLHYSLWFYSLYRPGSAPDETSREIPWTIVQNWMNVIVEDSPNTNPVWEQSTELEAFRLFARRAVATGQRKTQAQWKEDYYEAYDFLNRGHIEDAIEHFEKGIQEANAVNIGRSMDCVRMYNALAVCYLAKSQRPNVNREALLRRSLLCADKAIEICDKDLNELRLAMIPLCIKGHVLEILGSDKEAKQSYSAIVPTLVDAIGAHYGRWFATQRKEPTDKFEWDHATAARYKLLFCSIGDFSLRHKYALKSNTWPFLISSLRPREIVQPGAACREDKGEYVVVNGSIQPKLIAVKGIVQDYMLDAADQYSMLASLCTCVDGQESRFTGIAMYKLGMALKQRARLLKVAAWTALRQGKHDEAMTYFKAEQRYLKEAKANFERSVDIIKSWRSSSDTFVAFALFNLSDVEMDLFQIGDALQSRSQATKIYATSW
ncbi:MAG TPA: serine/threonine-protein kinase [Candidatus Obscuribacterales bacterium]